MYIGFDTSNYTTSVAVFDGGHICQQKKLLEVKQGERGLRQSDAVFQHTVNMPLLMEKISDNIVDIDAIGVSTRPRNIEGSYMPCFLVGKNTAISLGAVLKKPLYETSHQIGHILAALYSADKLDLINDKFIAFHVSGGTTEALLVEPDSKEIIKANLIAQSSDLKAGQAIDRTGVMLNMKFPCGPQLDELSHKSDKEFKIKPSMRGFDCSLSGVENKAAKMKADGFSDCDIAKYVISYISASIEKMTELLLEEYGNIPIIFAGGVMSNTILRKNISKKFNAFFAEPQFSCDNAAGIAIYAYLKDKYDSYNSISG